MDIVLKGLVKSFGKQLVIPPLDAVFKGGKFTTLLGPSGCGKTTLLRMIAGLESPDQGEIWLGDTLVFSSPGQINVAPDKRGLGFVFQDFSLWPHMTVFENVAFGLRARKEKNRLQERVRTVLETVRLDGFDTRYPHELSGGSSSGLLLPGPW